MGLPGVCTATCLSEQKRTDFVGWGDEISSLIVL